MSIFSPSTSNWNVPNALSIVRLLLAICVCYWLEKSQFLMALIGFIVAVSTDWIDGYWARRFQQVTKLGRILDPFVDKVIIAGAMIGLARFPESGLAPWMATLVVARELLVTSLRGMVEGKGGDFSAKTLGKWKMVAQCAAVIACLASLLKWIDFPGWPVARTAIIGLAILLTVASAVQYVQIALKGNHAPSQKTG
jgi:CDP-diacylglycerol--glycerol-3-phosphate 3-phosphatidyltransferase